MQKPEPSFVQADKKKKERRWSPRFWLGANFPGLFRLLARNRFAIGWRQFHIAVIDLLVSVINSFLGLLQSLWYGGRVERTEIKDAPIFVIGHWRCGTTLLHELLVLDSRFTYPTSFACFAPNHFLITERFANSVFKILLPSHRPMDDMTMQWDSPQEDEFALCNLGIPSPYMTIAFPNHPPQYPEYLDLEQVPPPDRDRWKRGLQRFLRQITFQNPKRIVLKSPPHTSRIKVLLELFPEARFVNIVRNPYAVYSSTVNMWKRMYAGHGFQTPHYQGLEERVLATFAQMHQTLEQTQGLVDPARYYEIRYEELVADPLGQIKSLYEHFGFDGFDQVAPAIEKYTSARSEYKAKRHELTPQEREEIARRWGPYMRKYGYSEQPAGV